MKATKFLFVMAMAVGLAACTKELVEPGKPVDSIEEVKGAKVIASGFSINPDASDIQTKIAIQDGKATWTPGDVAGVAWFVHPGDIAAQDVTKKADLGSTAYANHKLEYNKEGFESRSNVFEGWHVAYRPYVQMKKPGVIENITVNPALTRNLNEDKETARRLDRYENSPYFSGALFVSADDVNEEGVVSTPMPMQFVVNALTIDLKVDDSFGDQIKALKVESIELASHKDRPLFLNSLSVNPAAFPEDDPAFTAAHFGTANTFAFYGEKYEQTSVTEIAEENQANYTLGAGAGEGKFLRTRMFLAPVAEVADLKLSDLSLKVNLVDGEGASAGSFTLKANAKDTDKTNYDNFNKLYKLFTTGDEAGRTLKGLPGGYPTFEFKLKPADYKTNYVVSNEGDVVENMYKTIKFAREAGATSISLVFADAAEIPYDGERLEEALGEMIINCSSKKNGVTFVISDVETWNSNIVLGKYMNIEVVGPNGDLTIAENNKATKTGDIFPVANLTNAGIVNVGKDVNITAASFANTGVINVSKGSVFTLTDGIMPTNVVYTVLGNEETIVIDDLITNTNLATLIVDEVEEWNTLNTNADWTGLTVKMNASKITAPATITIKVNALEITGTENEITCKTLAVGTKNPVIIPEGASATINAAVNGAVVANGNLTVGTISSTLTVADGVTVTTGAVSKLATIGEGAIVNAAAFNGGVNIAKNAEVTVTGFKNVAIKGALSIAEEAVVNVTGNITGDNKTAITVAAGATLDVTGNVTNSKGVTIGNTANVSIEGNVSSALTIGESGVVTVSGNITGDVTVDKAATLEVEGNITGAVTVAEGANVTVTGDIAGDVEVAEGATIAVEGDIAAGKINVAAETFAVTGDINITSDDAEADVVIGKNTEFTLFGDVTGTNVEVVINGNATLKHTNMPASSKLTVNGNVTIDTEFMEGIRVSLGNVDNNGTLTVVGGTPLVNEKYVYVYNLDLEGSTTTTVKAGNTLYYYGEVTLGGSTSGTIKKAATPDPANGYEVIGDTYYVNAENGLAKAIANATEETINVVLETAVKLNAADFGAKNIVIDGGKDKKQITFNKTSVGMHPISAKSIEIKNATIETGENIGAGYHQHALVFDCPVKMEGVVTETTIFLRGKNQSTFNNVTFKDSYDSYSLWLDPNGQNVNVTGCTFECARGIKVDDRDMSKFSSPYSVEPTTLSVNGTTFTTQKKAAVVVHSADVVNITWNNNNIQNVTAAPEVPVWIDEEVREYLLDVANKYINNVVVNGERYPSSKLIAIEE